MESMVENGDSEEWTPDKYEYFSRIQMNPLSQFPISTLFFDTNEELLWCGNVNGRVASFSAQNNYERYTAYVAGNGDIRALDANDAGVFALSANSLRANNRFGLTLFNHSSHNMTNLSAMFRLPRAPTLLLGGDQQRMIQFDFEKQRELRVAPIREKNVSTIRSNGSHIFTSDADGNVSMRSMSTLETIKIIPKAHGGPITDFDIIDNKLITCGCAFRVNGLHGDPYVKVYDLRTFNPLQPLALSFAPIFTRFLSESSAIFGSQMGQATITDLEDRSQDNNFLIMTDGYALNAFASSDTKQLIAFGDEIGNIHVYTDRNGAVINSRSFDTVFAEPPLGPPLSFPIDDIQTPLASVPMPFSADEELLSYWPEDLCQPIFRKQKPLRGTQIVKNIQYLSYALNPMAGTAFGQFNIVPYFLDEVQPQVEEAIVDRPVVVPQFYHKLKQIRTPSKRGGKADAALNAVLKCNKSELVPLEHTSSWGAAVNPVVHLLFALPELRNMFLCHMCEEEHCIACQLGFLFRMMCDRSPKTCCSSSNLVRSIIGSGCPQLSEDPTMATQEALNYVVDCIDKAFIGEEGQRIADILQTELYMNSRCIRCHEMGTGAETKLLLTLQYNNVAEHFSLCSLIEKALHQRFQREGDCVSCNSKTRHEETRRVKKLPSILLVDANPSCPRYRQYWEEQLKISERRPRYKVPEHEHALGAVGKAEKHCRYGTECRNRPYCKYSHGSGDWEAEIETWLADTGGEWKQFINKSFFAKVSDGIAILSENTTDSDVDTYDLMGFICETCAEVDGILDTHVVTLLKTNDNEPLSWVVVNDVLVTQVHKEEAVHLDPRWKLPIGFIYASRKSGVANVSERRHAISPTVFQTDSNLTGDDSFVKERSGYLIPGKGELVGIDAEFVNGGQGHGKMSVGRVSCLDSSGDIVLVDDFVATCNNHVVDDYLTPYSGILAADLDPLKSTKHLTTLKRVYLKLLHLVEKGVIFVGHGLQNDFSVLNIYVPNEQIRDTVVLFHLPNQRLLSLQFLALHLLGERIQENTHDSVEDARVALKLYKKYLELQEAGTLTSTIAHLYETGTSNNWRSSPTKSASPSSSAEA